MFSNRDERLTEKLLGLNCGLALNTELGDQFASTNAKLLCRDLGLAQARNPLVRQVMIHLGRHDDWLDLAIPADAPSGAVELGGYKEGRWGCNSYGMECLLLNIHGFGIRTGRLSTKGPESLATASRQLLLSGIDSLTELVRPQGGDCRTHIVAATRARLGHYNVTFAELMDRIRTYAETAINNNEEAA